MNDPGRRSAAAGVGRPAGPLLFVAVLVLWRHDAMGVVAGLTAWMAVWWMTEAIPIPATSLLPMAVLPVCAGTTFKLADVAPNYGNWRVYLFFGGFLIAIAMEVTGLHRRIALHLVRRIGASPRRLVFGFMVATAFLSMWISNTATTLMMLPIGLAVIAQLPDRPRFATAMMLGIAYGASIGGVATLIGTPPNISLLGVLKTRYPAAPEVTFAQWMGLGLPLVLLFLPVTWLLLVRGIRREAGAGREVIQGEIERLGPMSPAERRVLVVFAATALLWIFRKPIRLGDLVIPGWVELRWFPEAARRSVNDGVVAVFMGLSLFLVPGGRGGAILDWDTVQRKMPWGILLLFGGGFALAMAIGQSGLSGWVGDQFRFRAHPLVLMAVCAAGVTFLTEVTSNTATAEILLPLVAGVATGTAQTSPLVLMLPVTLAASCAFMLPVATPPNAVVFGSGHVRMQDMVRHGLVVNLVGIVLVAAVCYLLGPLMLGIDYGAGVPTWAR
ncbi:MAG: SLC13 family permease [Planctomycetota bacterium]